jgi:hypothetical protein
MEKEIKKPLTKDAKTKAISMTVIGISIIVLAYFLTLIVSNVVNFYIAGHDFKWQSPVIFQTPLEIKTKAGKEVSLKVVQEVKAQEPDKTNDPQYKSIPWYIDKIWAMESTRGKNNIKGSLQDLCEKKGEWNEYGYGGINNPICFKDKEEADITMIKWFEKNLRTKSLMETFCYYRHGEKMQDCEYYNQVINL